MNTEIDAPKSTELTAYAAQLAQAAPSRAEIRLGCLCYATEIFKASPADTWSAILPLAQEFADWVEQALE